ncbi:hypothetical protein K474DRAFT_1776646 [Panus rudis PR-1116 ss-1]|nr:hypothetical protein K474DRAFT_1776646 [Panus rudis PR-1116 ss-1]
MALHVLQPLYTRIRALYGFLMKPSNVAVTDFDDASPSEKEGEECVIGQVFKQSHVQLSSQAFELMVCATSLCKVEEDAKRIVYNRDNKLSGKKGICNGQPGWVCLQSSMMCLYGTAVLDDHPEDFGGEETLVRPVD